jgi:predicted transcriptional regulator
MKKDIILTVRVDEKMYSLIQSLAKEDDRTQAWMTRRLLEVALQARGLIKAKKQ